MVAIRRALMAFIIKRSQRAFRGKQLSSSAQKQSFVRPVGIVHAHLLPFFLLLPLLLPSLLLIHQCFFFKDILSWQTIESSRLNPRFQTTPIDKSPWSASSGDLRTHARTHVSPFQSSLLSAVTGFPKIEHAINSKKIRGGRDSLFAGWKMSDTPWGSLTKQFLMA